MPKVRKPTDAELALLRVLWEHGDLTVREIHDLLAGTRSVAYTTTLKTVQIMTAKGLTVRQTVRGQHIYRAAQTQRDTERRLVGDLLERAFGGSAARLVVHALKSKPVSREELREIRQLLADKQEANHD